MSSCAGAAEQPRGLGAIEPAALSADAGELVFLVLRFELDSPFA